MTQRDLRAYLHDVAEACRMIETFTAGKSFDDYTSDPMLRSAVERQFEIVGEALNQGMRTDSGLEKQISHARRIVAFRNRLIHGYATVADEVVWGVVESYLPTLRSEIDQLLAKK